MLAIAAFGLRIRSTTSGFEGQKALRATGQLLMNLNACMIRSRKQDSRSLRHGNGLFRLFHCAVNALEYTCWQLRPSPCTRDPIADGRCFLAWLEENRVTSQQRGDDVSTGQMEWQIVWAQNDHRTQWTVTNDGRRVVCHVPGGPTTRANRIDGVIDFQNGCRYFKITFPKRFARFQCDCLSNINSIVSEESRKRPCNGSSFLERRTRPLKKRTLCSIQGRFDFGRRCPITCPSDRVINGAYSMMRILF